VLRSILSRPLWACLLVALTLGGALEIHPAGETPGPAPFGRRLAVPQSGHPVTSTHVEAAFDQEVPLCPACLLRSETRGARLLAAALFAAPALAERVEAAAPRSAEWRASRPAAARAPPLA
jgi:hypothetical protein